MFETRLFFCAKMNYNSTYQVNSMGKIYVIGGANVDIQGSSVQGIIPGDSNIGHISYSFGGVGRNIAENLALLGTKPVFVSVFGNDSTGTDMYRYCEAVGMDLSYSVKTNHVSSTYLAVMDEKNDMVVAINDMHILDLFTVESVKPVMEKIGPEDYLVLDTNVSEEVLEYCTAHSKAPVAVDPISTVKAEKIAPYLSRVDLFKPNKLEAEHLSGISITDEKSAADAVQYFLDKGVKNIVISLGRDGSAGGNAEGIFRLRHPFTAMKNATGAGDSFIAALVYARWQGKNLEEAVKFACAAASVTVESVFTVSENMNYENVKSRMDSWKFEKEILR